MHRVIPLTFVLLIIPALCFGTHAVERVATSEAQGLESFVGKYPSELLKAEPAIRRRLKTLLGANYAFFMERMQTEMPIERDEGALVARGCMAHSCGIEESVMVIRLDDRKIHCAILSARYGGKFRVFSEDKAHIPAALNRAMKQP